MFVLTTLMTGVNVPDHAAMFESLKLMIKDRITRHVVSLRSTTSQTVKSIIASTVTQLLPSTSAQVTLFPIFFLLIMIFLQHF